jgi:membrane protein
LGVSLVAGKLTMPRRRSTVTRRALTRAAVIAAAASPSEREGMSRQRGAGASSSGHAGDAAAGTRRWAAVRALPRLLRAAWHEYERDYARYFAVAMIYYVMASLVPLLLLLMAGLGLLLRFSPAADAVQQAVLGQIQMTFGNEVGTTIERLVHALEQQSVVSLTVSVIGLLATASVLVHHLQMSFRAIWHYPSILESGPPLVLILRMVIQKVLAFGIVVAGGVILGLVLLLIASVNWLTDRLSGGWAAAIPASLVIAPLTFALLFRYLPPKRLPWREVWLAALLCGCAWLVTARLLSLSGSLFGKNFSTYGAVGGLLAAMVAINIMSQCLFFGAELCKIRSRAAATHRPHPPVR